MLKLFHFKSIKLSGPTILAAGVVIGLMFPDIAEYASPLLPASVFIFVIGSFVRLDLGIFRAALVNPAISLRFPIICMVVVPVALWYLAVLFGLSAALCIGILMYAASPPSTGNAAVAKMFSYHGESPMAIIVVSTIMVPVSVPLLIGILSDQTIAWRELAERLILFLGSAVLVAAILRHFLSNIDFDRTSSWIDRTVLGALFVFALATMSGVQAKLLLDPWSGLFIVFVAYFVNCGLQLLGAFLISGNRAERIALGLTMGNRNIGPLWAVTGAGLAPETLLFFAATQLPIFTLPLLIKTALRVL